MRQCVVIRGAPGSGKTSLINKLGWRPWALGMDDLRSIRSAPVLSTDGSLRIIRDEDASVFTQYISLIETRADRGEFLVLDGLFLTDVDRILKPLIDNGYTVLVVDLSSMPVEQVLSQNAIRQPPSRLPDSVITEVNERYRLTQSSWPTGTVVIRPTADDYKTHDDADLIAQIKAWADTPVHDFSKYSRVVHIGDLQGCFSVLTGPTGPLADWVQPDTAYVFVGDLLDRGIENGAVLRWFVDVALPNPNVFLIFGNHEEHLRRWAAGQPAVSAEFSDRTLPQLLDAGLTPADAGAVCRRAVEALFYRRADQSVMVTHAGLPTVPEHPHTISTRQYTKGTGFWSDPIDQQFDRHAPPGWVQVHGHRNHGWQAIQASPRSFNLEDQVEFGGDLRWAVLDDNGWSTGSATNKVFNPNASSGRAKPSTPWSVQPGVSVDTLAALRAHSGIKEKSMADLSYVSSFNFKKHVFFDASWDNVVVKARGFFVNPDSGDVVARGYDKFFNIGERPETEVSALAASMTFPVTCYRKENGFLGNLGYDPVSDSLFVASKSTNTGEFADIFRSILDARVSPWKQNGLRRWLRDNNACMTFEVIDPIRDPHMIAYPEPTLILLDIFHRTENAERLPYKDLCKVAKRFDLPCKEVAFALSGPAEFAGWHNRVHTDLAWHTERPMEGVVIEDASGFQTKFKTAHYSFWKRMRSRRDRIDRDWRARLADLGPDPDPMAMQMARDRLCAAWDNPQTDTHPLARAFLSHCVRLDPVRWQDSIIALKDDFMATHPDPTLWRTPFVFDGAPVQPAAGLPHKSTTKTRR